MLPFLRSAFTRDHVFRGLKVALGASAAILIAGLMGLSYSGTAGIVTVLSILGTKRETLVLAGVRLVSFAVALGVAALSYGLLGFTLAGFAVYLFLFAVICYALNWSHSVSMMSVLVLHFLTEQSMAPAALLNEALLLLTGAACGVAVNLHLHSDEERVQKLLQQIDARMRRALVLLTRAEDAEADELLSALEGDIRTAGVLAFANANNRLFSRSYGDIRLLDMRAQQRKVLVQLRAEIKKIPRMPPQGKAVAAFTRRMAEELGKPDGAGELLRALNALLEDMRAQSLPATRAEFEARALLYAVLLRLGDFLRLRRQYDAETEAAAALSRGTARRQRRPRSR
ncbi:MAG: aromatic acid exporter family protein [Clostridia bacterium]|nr:aromatic acid exporter family protein [Clostridia bacterium]